MVAIVSLKPGTTLSLEEPRACGAERLTRYKLPARSEALNVLRPQRGGALKFGLRKRF